MIISLLTANHSLSPGLLKGRRFFNALGTCCFGFDTTKSLKVIEAFSLELGINSVPWSVNALGNNWGFSCTCSKFCSLSGLSGCEASNVSDSVETDGRGNPVPDVMCL